MRSAARVALPVRSLPHHLAVCGLSMHLPQSLNTDELLKLIKELIKVESRWIPDLPGYSLYIRPTIIGTREGMCVVLLFVLG